MDSKSFENAFQRHPRPQLPTIPTKNALLLKAQLSPEPPQNVLELPPKITSWDNVSRLGDLVQHRSHLSVGICNGTMIMLKTMNLATGKRILEKTKLLKHTNIAQVIDTLEENGKLSLMFEYIRFTLEEVLNVHMPLDEPHIRAIAQPVIKNTAFNRYTLTSLGLFRNQIHGYNWYCSPRYFLTKYSNLWSNRQGFA
jgi:hypothetical protein